MMTSSNNISITETLLNSGYIKSVNHFLRSSDERKQAIHSLASRFLENRHTHAEKSVLYHVKEKMEQQLQEQEKKGLISDRSDPNGLFFSEKANAIVKATLLVDDQKTPDTSSLSFNREYRIKNLNIPLKDRELSLICAVGKTFYQICGETGSISTVRIDHETYFYLMRLNRFLEKHDEKGMLQHLKEMPEQLSLEMIEIAKEFWGLLALDVALRGNVLKALKMIDHARGDEAVEKYRGEVKLMALENGYPF